MTKPFLPVQVDLWNQVLALNPPPEIEAIAHRALEALNPPESSRRKKHSKYRGISYIKSRDRWVAQISFRGQLIHLGSAKTEEGAYQKYIENLEKKGLLKWVEPEIYAQRRQEKINAKFVDD